MPSGTPGGAPVVCSSVHVWLPSAGIVNTLATPLAPPRATMRPSLSAIETGVAPSGGGFGADRLRHLPPAARSNVKCAPTPTPTMFPVAGSRTLARSAVVGGGPGSAGRGHTAGEAEAHG